MGPFAFGDYELDEARFELRHRGDVVSVQPKVLELLLYLVAHRDRVVSRDELLEQVWGDVMVTEASLTQAVSLARRAVQDSPAKQWALRTVRRRGLQFVASVSEPTPLVEVEPVVRRVSASTTMETADGRRVDTTASGPCPFLSVALHCDAVEDGSAHWSLDEVDEVLIGRGSARQSEFVDDVTPHLKISITGRQVSRKHARLVRTSSAWMVVDQGARNGVSVNGAPVKKHELAAGDIIGCGRTLFRFDYGARADVARVGGEPKILSTALPHLLRLDADLTRVAKSDVPVLITGESGTGKTHVAAALHGLGGRRGDALHVEAATLSRSSLEGAPFARAEGGTLVLENVGGLEVALGVLLAGVLEAMPSVRVVATSIMDATALEHRLVAPLFSRIAGFVAHLPPLRERCADLGALMATIGGHVAVEEQAGLAMLADAWPGNVRGLLHAVRAGLALSAGDVIRLEHLPDRISS